MSEERDHKKIMRGMKNVMKSCSVCGRSKTRHTIKEARECQEKEDDPSDPNYFPVTKVSHLSEEYIMKNGKSFRN